ncbi:RNA polymerase subunit sigma-70 [Megasphaera sueciensis]|uniref:RNA polymerase subunit sigma-70 n=1 Tax=Megasphaera sueciensis TaxID=349094 RepID=UPI003D074612
MKQENIASVKYYLQHYQEITTYIANVKGDIVDYEAKLPLNAAPKVSSLSPAPCGSNTNVSQEERIFIEKEAIPDKIAALRAELDEKEPIINRLNRSLEALTESDRMIVCNKYIKEMSWKMTAACVNCSEGYCRKRSEKVLEILDEMIFGPGDIPVQMNLKI